MPTLRLGRIIPWVIGLGVACLWAMPLVWMVLSSFKPPSEAMAPDIGWLPQDWTLQNYRRVLDYPILLWARNSLIVSITSTVLCVVSGAMAGYALARFRFAGREALFLLFMASLMVPFEVQVVPLLLGFISVGWASTFQALILPSIANVFSVYIFRQFYLKFPREIEEAAEMDGAGPFAFFWRVAFPLARAPMIAASVIVFNVNWNNFLWPLLVTFDDRVKTMPVGIAAFAPSVGSHNQLESFGPGMAAATLLCLPSVGLFLLLQRYFVQGVTAGSVKG